MIDFARNCCLVLIIMTLVPGWGFAYEVVLDDGSVLVDKDVVETNDFTRFRCGFASVHYGDKIVERIDLNDYSSEEESLLSNISLVGVAEASEIPQHEIIQSYLYAHATIKSALHLKDVQSVISHNYFQMLSDKVRAGAQEIVLLEMIKNLLPNGPSVYDARVKNDQAKLAAMGSGQFGDVHGVVDMVHEEGAWKLNQTQWIGGGALDMRKIDPTELLSFERGYLKEGRISRLQWEESPYYMDKNPLSLTRKKLPLEKRAFNIVFFLEKGKKKKTPNEHSLKNVKSSQLHILWTGPRRLIPEQREYIDRYPLDVSIAHYKEGYKSGNFNLLLPRKKPRGVFIHFWMQF